MKKARMTVFLFILLLAFAMTSNEESPRDSSENLSGNSPNSDLQSKNSLSNYIPSLSVFAPQALHQKEMGVLSKKILLQNIGSGNGYAKLGVSKEVDMPKLGPGAFVFIKNRNSFAVLDNENNRINFYPLNPNEKPTSINFPQNRQALGLSLDQSGQVTMLSRQFDPESGASFPFYEIWKLNSAQTDSPWLRKQNFSFSDRATHGAAQSLEMQSIGDTLIFKGLGENEFHVLSQNQKQTQKLPGFPTQQGTYIRTQAVENSKGEQQIQIQEFNEQGTLKSHKTNEDMARLSSYRVLPNGTVALDLEADIEKNLPREIVMINPKTGQVKARSVLRTKEDVHVDQDIYFDNSRVFQLAEGPKEPNAKNNFEFLQTDFGEE